MAHEEWSVARAPGESSSAAQYAATVIAALMERRTALEAALAELQTRAGMLAEVADLLVRTLQAGGKVLAAGNGGSAAEAQHFVAELVGRFKRERSPYAALALSTDTSILTAVANDYGYAEVFARQVRALGRPEDVLVAFSTSGESENLVRAARAAHGQGMMVVAVTGARASRLSRAADLGVRVPLRDTALTQELHMAVTHILCDITESVLAEREAEQEAAHAAHGKEGVDGIAGDGIAAMEALA